MKRFDVEKLDGTGLIQIEAKDLSHAKEKAAAEVYGHAKVRYSAGSWHEYGQALSLVENPALRDYRRVRSTLEKVTQEEISDLSYIQARIEGKYDKDHAILVLENLREDRQDVFRCLDDVIHDAEDGKITSSKYGAFMGLMKKHSEGLADFFEVVAS